MNPFDIEQNPKLGYYKVADRTFYSKPEAYIYATERGMDPIWHFNTVTYAKTRWDIEPELDIRELYRMRAQQLRDRYDWIRVEASGGGDSTTAIFAFLLNGIHLDEVIFRYPKAGEKGVTNDPFTTNPINTLSEWQFAARPLLDWIKTNYPKTVCTVHDYSEDMLAEEGTRDESWVFTTRDWLQPGHGSKHTHFGTQEHRALADSGKTIAVVYGIDKPKITVVNNGWYGYFIDLLANHANPVVDEYTNITSELFYWTPDFPEISVKQAHMIRRWFDMPQNQHLRHLVNEKDPNRRTTYEWLAKSIIYPDYDLHTWQTSKPTNSFHNEMDYWFYTNFKETNLYSTWEKGLEFLVDKIDSKYFYKQFGKPMGFGQNYSPYYYIGPAAEISGQPAMPNRQVATTQNLDVTLVQDRRIKKLSV
jgi:hypothetical protein